MGNLSLACPPLATGRCKRGVNQQSNKSIGQIHRMHECIDTSLGCRWNSFHVLSLPLTWLGFFSWLIVFLSQALLLFTPPLMFPSLAWSINHWCCIYHLFLWSLSVCLCANLLVCCRQRLADWLWFIVTPASVLWLAQSWLDDAHALKHTHASQPVPTLTGTPPTPPLIPERTQNRQQTYLSCSPVIRHGGYQLCLFTD